MTGAILAADPLKHVVQHTFLEIDLPGETLFLDQITILSNQVVMQLIAAGLLVWLLPKIVMQRRSDTGVGRLVPRAFGNGLEALCLGLREQVVRPQLGKHTDTFIGYIWSVFFFILTCNLLGLIPISDFFGIFPGVYKYYFGGTATGNVMLTAALALTTLSLVIYNGFKYNGMEYVKHFFMGPAFIAWFIAILEMFGLLAKTFALAVRLCANMMGGHLALAVFLGFVGKAADAGGEAAGAAVAIPVILMNIAFNFLEIFVAFFQAFIFTFLSAVFLGQAVVIHHDDDHDEEHGHASEAAGAH